MADYTHRLLGTGMTEKDADLEFSQRKDSLTDRLKEGNASGSFKVTDETFRGTYTLKSIKTSGKIMLQGEYVVESPKSWRQMLALASEKVGANIAFYEPRYSHQAVAQLTQAQFNALDKKPKAPTAGFGAYEMPQNPMSSIVDRLRA